MFYLVLLALGLIGGFFSGLLGLGGAIIMVPLLLYVPPLFHLTALNMKVVAGVSTIQVFASAASGVIFHRKKRAVSIPVLLFMGLPSAIAGLLGALFSKYVDAHFLLTIFACISTLATLLMFIPKKEESAEQGQELNADKIQFNRALATLLAIIIGFIGGMIGAPGAFIFIPVCVYILKIPMRITIGSTLGIVLMTAFTSTVGKIASGQMHWLIAGVLILGSVTAAQLGSRASHRVPVKHLHKIMTVIIAFSSLKMWLDVIH